MQQETKICQNCKQNFFIEPQDFAFYQKIRMPLATFCSQCRLQRRLVWRNERHLYARSCDHCHKAIIAVYAPEKSYQVYCHECWYADTWSALDYGRDYDFSRPFFEQFAQLLLSVPRLSLNNTKSFNSDYTNYAAENKDCYLCVSAVQNENCAYSTRIRRSRDCLDCLNIEKCELCYACIECEQCSGSFFLQNCNNVAESYYCYDCRGCFQCFCSVGLRNKSYHWFNQPLEKGEYEKRLQEILASPTKFRAAREQYTTLLERYPRRYAYIVKSYNVTGDYITFSKNCQQCFYIKSVVDANNTLMGGDLKDACDVSFDDHSELSYEIMSGEKDHLFTLGTTCWYVRNVTYSDFCLGSSNLFGCVGLRDQRYCILNKQYTKEEYETMIPRIIAHIDDMPYRDAKGRIYRYGEFFPIQFFPLTKDQALSQGYSWKESEKRNAVATISSEKFGDDATIIDGSILKEVIACQHEGKCNEQCTGAFRIIPPELDFYRKMKLPLPCLCPNCRHYQRLAQRNPLKLWRRQCQCAGLTDDRRHTTNDRYKNTVEHFHKTEHCPNAFETSYSPERKEIVYCEQCYVAEVA